MAKKPSKDEITREFYGINPTTFKVESVSYTRGGTLSKWGAGGGYHSESVMHGRDPRAEVNIIYGLIEIEEFHPQYTTSERRKEIRDKLEAKAAEMMKRSSSGSAGGGG
jgi:hypothetical protein